MPALEGGDVEFAQKQAHANVASLLPLARDGYRIEGRKVRIPA